MNDKYHEVILRIKPVPDCLGDQEFLFFFVKLHFLCLKRILHFPDVQDCKLYGVLAIIFFIIFAC